MNNGDHRLGFFSFWIDTLQKHKSSWRSLGSSGWRSWRRLHFDDGAHEGVLVARPRGAAVVLIVVRTPGPDSREDDVIRHSVPARRRLQ